MSNRNLAFLILFAICTSILGFVYYFFIANVGSVIFSVEWPNYVKISIAWEYWSKYDTDCTKICLVRRLPPVNYTIKIENNGYKTYTDTFKLERWEAKEIKIKMQKEVKVDEVSQTTETKIKSLKYRKFIAWKSEDVGITIERNEIWTYWWNIYSYTNNKWFFDVFEFDWNTENEIFNLEWINIDNIWLNAIDWIIMYETKEWNYFYDIDSKTNYKTTINDDIIFIKKTWENDKYIVDGKMWVYIYNTTSNDYTKNTLYDDFVILEDSKVLWLIKATSKDKINILNFTDNWKNKLVLHNITTKEKKVIYETDSKIMNIFYKDWNVKFSDENDKLYNLTELNLE